MNDLIDKLLEASNPPFASMILRQLGGNRFMAMTGAKNLAYSKADKSLSMKFGRVARGKSNFMKITLTSADLYDIEFGNVRGYNFKVKVSLSGIQAASLKRLVKQHTGLSTSLHEDDDLEEAVNPRQPAWVKLFDKMAAKKMKTIQMDATGVMGGNTDGFRAFARGRMGKPKSWRGGIGGPFTRVSMSIVALDGNGKKIPMRSGYKLWKDEYTSGKSSISVSIGDMGLMLQGLKA